MPMKTFLVAAFLLIGVGLLNQSAYRVKETEKAILLEFGNLIDARSTFQAADRSGGQKV